MEKSCADTRKVAASVQQKAVAANPETKWLGMLMPPWKHIRGEEDASQLCGKGGNKLKSTHSILTQAF